MIKLEFLKLLDILPQRLKTTEISALVNAIDDQLHEIAVEIDKIIIMPRIEEQPENIVDSLAWQLHVDFYEPLGLDLNTKRLLVKNSILWHKHKGTKYVLEDMIRILFFDNFKIEEWFEYDGRPAFFRLVARESLQDLEQYKDLIRAIYELKNERSWLDMLQFEDETDVVTYTATALSKRLILYTVEDVDEIPQDIVDYNSSFTSKTKTLYTIEDIAKLPATTQNFTSTVSTVIKKLKTKRGD